MSYLEGLEDFKKNIRKIKEQLDQEKTNRAGNGTATVLDIPIKHKAFVEANPLLAKVVGMGVSTVSALMRDLERTKNLLASDMTLALVENGTKEEAKDFIQACFEAIVKGNMKQFYGVSEEEYESMKEKIKGSKVECQIGIDKYKG